ncbi:transposase [Sporosarcina sp. Marseille-Q4943]|uniref:transposase n=1 Tax=Sporosarcina sp. Marseille-Q4943 TaxID=2942204 RepID=UPI00208DB987|nr:transposase [Sporosarcina sp. Marseille-Q4943]
MGKRIDDDLKKHLVKLVLEEGKKQTDVSREMGIPLGSLRRWVSEHRQKIQAERDGVEYLTPTEQMKRQRDMEKQIRDLQEENEILKKAMHIFSRNPQ